MTHTYGLDKTQADQVIRYPARMRWESRAYGTRQEIIDHIQQTATAPGRSERRMAEGAKAVVALEEGDDEVTYGRTVFVVVDS